MTAARYDSSRMVQYLFDLGYKTETREANNNTPLHVAVKFKNIAILRLLARQPHINFSDSNGRSPLAVAIILGNKTATDIFWQKSKESSFCRF